MLRETGGNLARNVVMTVAAIVTMAVSLTALGGVLIMRQAVNQATVQYQGGVELVVFMDANASAQEIAGLRQQLLAMEPDEVRSFRFVDKAEAFAEFKSMFAGQPAMQKVMTAQKMPPSFRCVPAKAQNVAQLAVQLEKQPGVLNVGYPGQAIKEELDRFATLRNVALVVAGGVMLGAIALVVNTIQLAIFARRPRSCGHEAGRRYQLVHPGAVHAGGPGRGFGGCGGGFCHYVLGPRHPGVVYGQQPAGPQPAPLRELARGPVHRRVCRGRRDAGGGVRIGFRGAPLPVGLIPLGSPLGLAR